MTAKKDKEQLSQMFFYPLVRKINQLDTEGAVTVVESPKSRKTCTIKVKSEKIFKETTQQWKQNNKKKKKKILKETSFQRATISKTD